MFLGNFRRDSCNYSPSSSPDVINVAGTQQAVDAPHPGKFARIVSRDVTIWVNSILHIAFECIAICGYF